MKKTKTIEYLKNKWDLITEKTDESNAVFLKIIEAYSQKHRFFHTIYHLEYIFNQFDKINYFNKNVFFATFFHDFVYRIGYKFNEEHSAFILRSHIEKLGVNIEDIVVIEDYIKKTKYHNKSNDIHLNIFLDADISILASDSENFDLYCKNIRREYITVDYQIFYRSRYYFFNDLIKNGNIFHSKYFSHLETKAQYNIEKEMKIISSFF